MTDSPRARLECGVPWALALCVLAVLLAGCALHRVLTRSARSVDLRAQRNLCGAAPSIPWGRPILLQCHHASAAARLLHRRRHLHWQLACALHHIQIWCKYGAYKYHVQIAPYPDPRAQRPPTPRAAGRSGRSGRRRTGWRWPARRGGLRIGLAPRL
jgi:hypothetical protein